MASCGRSRDAHDIEQAAHARHRRGVRIRHRHADRRAGDDEADPPRIVRFGQPHAGDRLIMSLHDDVLEQLAGAGFDRPLVVPVHLEVVRDRAELADLVGRRFGEDQAGAVAVLRARRVELLERLQPRRDAGQLVLDAAQLATSARRGRRARPPARCHGWTASTRSDVERLARPRHRLFGRRRGPARRASPRRAGLRLRPPAWRAARESWTWPRSRAPWHGEAPSPR